MSEAKPFASLSSGLLARKGAAKPAMRPQGFGQMTGMGLEDLGWNDMGHAQPQPPVCEAPAETASCEHVPSSIAALTPAPRLQSVEAGHQLDPEPQPEAQQHAPPPVVVEQQRAIEERFAASSAEHPSKRDAEVVALPPRPRAAADRAAAAPQASVKPKAAFTLRLEEQRHLKLRLACAITRRSAQQIVTEALDDFLASLPELETLAGHVPTKLGKRS